MFETQIIGNLGKDAETRQSDNGSYTVINVCYSKNTPTRQVCRWNQRLGFKASLMANVQD